MKKTILSLMGLILVALSACSASDRAISPNELPRPAKDLLTANFDGKSVSKAVAESDGDFEVVLADGTKIDFDAAGQWTDIEAARGDSIPTALIPPQIAEKAVRLFPGASVVKIEKNRDGWDVKLSNRMEMEFTTSFDLVKTEQD